MDAHASPLTPRQAQEQLAAAQSRPLASPRDRNVHAGATAALGATIAVFFAAQNIAIGVGWVVLTAVFAAVSLAMAWWVERAARTVPRRTRLISRVGLGATMVGALFGVVPWLNFAAQVTPNTWSMVLTGAGLAAAPSLLAAVLIMAGRR